MNLLPGSLVLSIKKLAHSNAECGFRNAEFKTKNSIECYHKADSSKFKAQTKTVTPDWQATGTAERTIENDICLSGKHNFYVLPFFSQILYNI